jgi:hypothetical protein
MTKINVVIAVFSLVFLICCSGTATNIIDQPPDNEPFTGEAEILQSWQGDYPVDRLNLLQEDNKEQGVGFLDNYEPFMNIWKAFKPGEDIPKIDFAINLVLYARNTQFFNRIRIGKVNVINGIAELIAMETLSAMPIEDKVAISFVVVPRQGIVAIKARGGNILIDK